MNDIVYSKRTTFLLAFVHEDENTRDVFFQHSTAKLCREQGVLYAGIKRDEHTVVVFCDYIHGDDFLDKDELREIATWFLDGEIKTQEFDLRQ